MVVREPMDAMAALEASVVFRDATVRTVVLQVGPSPARPVGVSP